jgi:leader peptidase (prepilin peptidase) / N-methyltransferase
MPVFAAIFVGLLLGGLINVLADDLPRRRNPRRPRCLHCGYQYGPFSWLATTRLIAVGRPCPECGQKNSWRGPLVEIGMVFYLPLLFLLLGEENMSNFWLYALYSAILILVIVVDLEHRLILHVVTFPTTLFAILIGAWLDSNNLWYLALLGAVAGYSIFYLLYLLGGWIFGPGALGFGDVTLAMTLGAMLGLHRLPFALILGIFLGGAASLLLVVTRRGAFGSRFAYGPYLAAAGLIMLIWGMNFVNMYVE